MIDNDRITGIVSSVIQSVIVESSKYEEDETVDEDIVAEQPDGSPSICSPGQATIGDFIGHGSIPPTKAKGGRKKKGRK